MRSSSTRNRRKPLASRYSPFQRARCARWRRRPGRVPRAVSGTRGDHAPIQGQHRDRTPAPTGLQCFDAFLYGLSTRSHVEHIQRAAELADDLVDGTVAQARIGEARQERLRVPIGHLHRQPSGLLLHVGLLALGGQTQRRVQRSIADTATTAVEIRALQAAGAHQRLHRTAAKRLLPMHTTTTARTRSDILRQQIRVVLLHVRFDHRTHQRTAVRAQARRQIPKARSLVLERGQIRVYRIQNSIHHRMNLGARCRRVRPLLRRLPSHECTHRKSPSSCQGNTRGEGNRLVVATTARPVPWGRHFLPTLYRSQGGPNPLAKKPTQSANAPVVGSSAISSARLQARAMAMTARLSQPPRGISSG